MATATGRATGTATGTATGRATATATGTATATATATGTARGRGKDMDRVRGYIQYITIIKYYFTYIIIYTDGASVPLFIWKFYTHLFFSIVLKYWSI